MKLIHPSHGIVAIYADSATGDPLHLIELCGRTCYKTEEKMTQDSAEKFVAMVKKRGHHSVLEHSAVTVKFITDVGVTHELVRHRIVAVSQESTRYCNYKGGVTFVIPPWLSSIPVGEYKESESVKWPDYDRIKEQVGATTWFTAMIHAEKWYIHLLNRGWTAQMARDVLPKSLKTEIMVTANLREWLHILTLRCDGAAHPQMRQIMTPLLHDLNERIPVIFGELADKIRGQVHGG